MAENERRVAFDAIDWQIASDPKNAPCIAWFAYNELPLIKRTVCIKNHKTVGDNNQVDRPVATVLVRKDC
jgi:hypothetical protein